MEDIRKNNNYCVYIHTSPSGKMYVGQTKKNPKARWANGKGYLTQDKNGKYNQPKFANAILKYGWDNFEHEIIANNLTKEEADNFEKLLIKKLNTMNSEYGYNCQKGGSLDAISEETKQKIKASQKTRKVAQYSLQGELIKVWDCINDASRTLGVYNINACCMNKSNHKTAGGFIWRYYEDKLTEEHIKLCNEIKPREMDMSLFSGANHPNAKKVVQYDLKGNLIKIWDTAKEVKNELHIGDTDIGLSCKGKRKTAGGFIWKYYGDELTEEEVILRNKSQKESSVAQYSLSGELIGLFNTIKEASLETNIYYTNISRCCLGYQKTAGGFIWKYYNDENMKIAI